MYCITSGGVPATMTLVDVTFVHSMDHYHHVSWLCLSNKLMHLINIKLYVYMLQVNMYLQLWLIGELSLMSSDAHNILELKLCLQQLSNDAFALVCIQCLLIVIENLEQCLEATCFTVWPNVHRWSVSSINGYSKAFLVSRLYIILLHASFDWICGTE